jgi:hypothetical protein
LFKVLDACGHAITNHNIEMASVPSLSTTIHPKLVAAVSPDSVRLKDPRHRQVSQEETDWSSWRVQNGSDRQVGV